MVSGVIKAANFLRDTVQPKIPEKVAGVTNYLAQTLGADGFKTIFVKPAVLIGQTLRFTGREASFPIFAKLASEANPMKVWICAAEVITKLPKMLEELAKPVEAAEPSRIYKKLDDSKAAGPERSPLESVFNRIFHVASWVIAVGDAIVFARSTFGSIPQKLDKATPWIYTIAGGYMGVQSLYTELKHAHSTWWNGDAQAVRAEKCFGCLNLAASTAYIFSSVVGGMGLYYKGQAPAWLGKCQFAASAGIAVMPFFQKITKAYMDKVVWA
jgi:hypothetical protein